MSLTQDIRNRWLAGETLNATDLAKELKCSSSVITMLKKHMTEEGYQFEATTRKLPPKQKGGVPRTYTDYHIVGTPNANGGAVPAASTNGNSNGTPALPTLGGTVTITLLAIDEHGTIRVGFKEGKRTWLCEVRSTTQ